MFLIQFFSLILLVPGTSFDLMASALGFKDKVKPYKCFSTLKMQNYLQTDTIACFHLMYIAIHTRSVVTFINRFVQIFDALLRCGNRSRRYCQKIKTRLCCGESHSFRSIFSSPLPGEVMFSVASMFLSVYMYCPYVFLGFNFQTALAMNFILSFNKHHYSMQVTFEYIGYWIKVKAKIIEIQIWYS